MTDAAGSDEQESGSVEARQRWMGILAKALPDEIEAAWGELARRPKYEFLRRPEVGLLMVRGRMGGDGRAFNLGEVTVTRCTVRLEQGRLEQGRPEQGRFDHNRVGHAVVLGRATRHAELAAALDAMMQDDDCAATVERVIITPLAIAQSRRRDAIAHKAAATRVEFFTLARGAV